MQVTGALFVCIALAGVALGCTSSSDDGPHAPGGEGGASGAGAGGAGGEAGASGETRWVGTWATAPLLIDANNQPPNPGLAGNTLRQIVLTSIGGEAFRVQFSNAFGTADLVLEAAHVAASADASGIDPTTDLALSFDGDPSVTIPAGEEVFSDPIERPLEPMSKLAVSVHFGELPDDLTGHPGSRTTSYLTEGDAVSEASLPDAIAVDRWYVLSGVDVLAPSSAAAISILGDSITDGYGTTTNANNRWPDHLSRRLRDDAETADVAILNMGIGGNAVLSGGLGPTARRRFERDVIAQRGVGWVVVAIGVNDLGASSGLGIADALITAYGEFIDVAHHYGLLVYGVPILPFGGSQYDTSDREAARQLVNDWVLTGGRFDAVIDLDSVMRDPENPTSLLPDYDSGDHLHPSLAGYEAMADAIELSLFTDPPTGEPSMGAGGAPSIGSGYPCGGFVPPAATINDFSSGSSGTWGSAPALSGGTFYYDNDGDDDVQALSIAVGDDEAGTVTGEVTDSYAGFGFWFGACVDASTFEGISFTLQGDLGGATIEFQAQTSRNYPIDDANQKGECEGSWSDCTNNKLALDIESLETATPFQIAWTDLAGGTPVDDMDATEILGIQWQLNCPSGETCTPSFVIDDVQFYPAD